MSACAYCEEAVAEGRACEVCQSVQHATIRKDGLDAKDRSVQTSVAQQSYATGVGRNVAAELTTSLGTQVEGHHKASITDHFVNRL